MFDKLFNWLFPKRQEFAGPVIASIGTEKEYQKVFQWVRRSTEFHIAHMDDKPHSLPMFIMLDESKYIQLGTYSYDLTSNENDEYNYYCTYAEKTSLDELLKL